MTPGIPTYVLVDRWDAMSRDEREALMNAPAEVERLTLCLQRIAAAENDPDAPRGWPFSLAKQALGLCQTCGRSDQ